MDFDLIVQNANLPDGLSGLAASDNGRWGCLCADHAKRIIEWSDQRSPLTWMR
ncbi:hypothetical protein PMI11_06263 [Rhizobium sp. CF142]|nr:hypothetical protein PMI11_06263 [Rhizobium sp. CF142]